MKLWQKVFVLNMAGLLGIASSLFLVPANTPFFPWLIVSVVLLAGFNVAIFGRFRRPASGTKPVDSKVTDVIITVGVVFWILDVLVQILRR